MNEQNRVYWTFAKEGDKAIYNFFVTMALNLTPIFSDFPALLLPNLEPTDSDDDPFSRTRGVFALFYFLLLSNFNIFSLFLVCLVGLDIFNLFFSTLFFFFVSFLGQFVFC